MAEQRINPREVRKIKTVIALDGQRKAERRFGNSPEMQQVQREQQKGRERAVERHRAARIESVPDPKTKENTTMNEKQQAQQKPAPTAAQQRVAQRQQAQARQNARLKERSASRAQGMGM